MDASGRRHELTEGQKRLAAHRESGGYVTPALGALVAIPFGVAFTWLTNGDWAYLNALVWVFAVFALLGHLKSEPGEVRAARYRGWLDSYEREMRETGRFDRGEPSGDF